MKAHRSSTTARIGNAAMRQWASFHSDASDVQSPQRFVRSRQGPQALDRLAIRTFKGRLIIAGDHSSLRHP